MRSTRSPSFLFRLSLRLKTILRGRATGTSAARAKSSFRDCYINSLNVREHAARQRHPSREKPAVSPRNSVLRFKLYANQLNTPGRSAKDHRRRVIASRTSNGARCVRGALPQRAARAKPLDRPRRVHAVRAPLPRDSSEREKSTEIIHQADGNRTSLTSPFSSSRLAADATVQCSFGDPNSSLTLWLLIRW